MALIVETGSGLTNANAFVSLSYFIDYVETRGRSTDAYDDEGMEAAIVRGTQFLSDSFEYKGWLVHGRGDSSGFQALSWPRQGVIDAEGHSVPSDSVPREIQWATSEVAWQELVEPHSMAPVYTPHDRVRMEKAGPVSVTYDTSRQDAGGARPILLSVRDLIRVFLDDLAGNRYCGRAVRGP